MNALFASAPAAWRDFVGIVARRWWVALGAGALVWLLAVIPLSVGGVPVLNILGWLVTFVVWLFVFEQTMRIDDPAYALTRARVFRIVIIALLVFLVTLVFGLAGGLIAIGARNYTLAAVWQLLVQIAISTKVAFVYFKAESESPLADSWKATSGRTFLPTLVFAACNGVVMAAISFLITLDPLQPSAASGNAALQVGAFLVAAFFTPWGLRWMHVADRAHHSIITETIR